MKKSRIGKHIYLTGNTCYDMIEILWEDELTLKIKNGLTKSFGERM